MDSGGGVEVDYCIGTEPSVLMDPEEEVDKLEDDEWNSISLLRLDVNEGLAGKKHKDSERKVQWNDHNGNNLVEVLEFQPSDSDDSENKCRCICTVM